MVNQPTKLIMVPLDGSANALKALAYLADFFGPDHDLDVLLVNVMAGLPPAMLEQVQMDARTARKLKKIETRYYRHGEKILNEGRRCLISRNYPEQRIRLLCKRKSTGVARDINAVGDAHQVDAILLNTLGRSRLEAFLIGETANKVLELNPIAPVWMMKGTVNQSGVLIALDSSPNALRTVDHAAFMLSGTPWPITLFHAQRHLNDLALKAILEEAPELEQVWQHAADQEFTPVLQEAVRMLTGAGIAPQQITPRIVAGSRHPDRDILTAAHALNCGTIIMGRRGSTGHKAYAIGNVSRKVLLHASDMSMWIIA